MRRAAPAAAVALGLVLGACGSSNIYTRPAVPSEIPPPAPAIVRITANGNDPQVAHVFDDKKVTFINTDTREHSIFSDLHPTHNDCGGVLNVGALQPGETREVTNLQIGACYFHDDTAPTTFAFRGLVIIH